MRPRSLSPVIESYMVSMYQHGTTTGQIAALFNLTVPGICKILKRNNVEMRSRGSDTALPEAVLTEYKGTRIYVANPMLHDVYSLMEKHSLSHAQAVPYWGGMPATHKTTFLWVNELHRPGLSKMIAHKAGSAERVCSARDCEVIQVSREVSSEFYNTWHIQGSCNSANCLGLTYQGDLVACMTFNSGAACRGNAADHLLQRFACTGSVPGGASKLLSHFRRSNPGSIISYSDKRYAVGGLYTTLGFKQIFDHRPDYRYWLPEKQAWHGKSRFQLKHLRPLMEAAGKSWEGLTEWDMSKSLGFKRCYDLGKLTWLLE